MTGGLYVGLAVAAALDAERRSAHPVDLVTLVAAFPVMHVAWGAGLLTSLVRRPTTG